MEKQQVTLGFSWQTVHVVITDTFFFFTFVLPPPYLTPTLLGYIKLQQTLNRLISHCSQPAALSTLISLKHVKKRCPSEDSLYTYFILSNFRKYLTSLTKQGKRWRPLFLHYVDQTLCQPCSEGYDHKVLVWLSYRRPLLVGQWESKRVSGGQALCPKWFHLSLIPFFLYIRQSKIWGYTCFFSISWIFEGTM